MIGHKNPRVNFHMIRLRIMPQPVRVKRHILFRAKTDLPVVAALNNVLGNTNRRDSRQSCHGSILVAIDLN
ncbi:hypothetical protein QWY82_05645 [Simiduia curdlanivorans]|uniref:Uncharacterized protein n=1 Tax=Simiduia curdlanivorans TaxID=1492769 RepID=A0ABV8V5J4_9GAMM|nr:hypothetical protein [Simiduia curdlanivorans]MDN3638295.1 hypothetical protein [Simiduia curdlanivorans]